MQIVYLAVLQTIHIIMMHDVMRKHSHQGI
jgi:hypothetical protein